MRQSSIAAGGDVVRSSYTRILGLGIAFVLAISTLGALLSRAIGLDYSKLSIVSYLVYFSIGFLVARVAGITKAMLTGLVLGSTDATAGWALSWLIGPGRPVQPLRPGVIPAIVLTVIALAIAATTLGGVIGRLTSGKEKQAV